MPTNGEIQVKADLHVHTTYSSDSLITLEDLVSWGKRRGLNAIAITDHNRVDGALKMARETDFLIIPGTEVDTANGHVVALNVQEPMPKGLSAEETVERIHEAGGIAVACHPFALFKSSIGKQANGKFDAVETINASASPFKRSVRKAEDIATRLKLPRVAGTDAHYAPAIGYAYTVIDAEPNAEAVAKAIKKGRCQPFGEPVPLQLKVEKHYKYFRKRIAGAFR